MKTMLRFSLVTAAFSTLAACAGDSRTASGFLCPNGRPEVHITSVAPSFGTCDPRAQDAVDKLVAEGREYRYLTMGEAMQAAASSGRVPASSPIGSGGVRAN